MSDNLDHERVVIGFEAFKSCPEQMAVYYKIKKILDGFTEQSKGAIEKVDFYEHLEGREEEALARRKKSKKPNGKN